MTSSNPGALGPEQAEAPNSDQGPVKPGIYLQEKKSTIGTGGTAKTAEYRTFWVTLRVAEASVEMLLLDDDFRPTAIREIFSHEVVLGPSWHFIVEGEKRYQRLRPHLDRLLAPPPPKAETKKAAPKATANWWGGGEPEGQPKDPFALDKSRKSAKPEPKKGGWWEK
jgi:hypothetical protein